MPVGHPLGRDDGRGRLPRRRSVPSPTSCARQRLNLQVPSASRPSFMTVRSPHPIRGYGFFTGAERASGLAFGSLAPAARRS